MIVGLQEAPLTLQRTGDLWETKSHRGVSSKCLQLHSSTLCIVLGVCVCVYA